MRSLFRLSVQKSPFSFGGPGFTLARVGLVSLSPGEQTPRTRSRKLSFQHRFGVLWVLILGLFVSGGCQGGSPGDELEKESLREFVAQREPLKESFDASSQDEGPRREGLSDAFTEVLLPEVNTSREGGTKEASKGSESLPESPSETSPESQPEILGEKGTPTPADCPGVSGVHGLNHGSGTIFGCAVLRDGSAACFLKSTSSSTEVWPLKYKGGAALKQVRQATGWGFTEEACVLLSTGAVHCGRIDPQGGVRSGISKTPVIAKGVVAISGGYEEMCALVREPGKPTQVLCWTKNHGADNLSNSPKRVPLDAMDAPIAISSRYQGNCVLLKVGSIKCWGSNNDGQLGRGNPPGDIQKPALTKPLAGRAVYLAAGQSHTCVVLAKGGLQCWGASWAYQLGLPGSSPLHTPQKLTLLKDVVAVACGQFHTCALLSTGEVRCTGKIGASTQWKGWRNVQGIKDAVAISAGKEYTCSLHRDGQVRCWGNPGGSGTPITMQYKGVPIQARAPTCKPP